MDTQQQYRSPHQTSNRPRAAIISLWLSGFSFLMLIFMFMLVSSVGYPNCGSIPNCDSLSIIVALLGLLLICLPSLLAIIFSFIAKRDSANGGIVATARTLSIILFTLSLLLVPLMLWAIVGDA